jgi:hypothetical protein
MRQCTKCGAVLPSRSLALQHQNGCASPIDPVLADAQHEHVRHEHRIDRGWYRK